MDMDGRTDTRFSFQLRILLLLLGSCWLLAGTFMVFQYHREKEYKTGMMNTRLQMHNARLLDDLRKGEPIGNIVSRISSPTENLRVTLIGRDGKVIYDSSGATPTSDHNTRPEVRAARVKGEGYAIERVSEEDNTTYFYSALAGDDGMVVRSAAPYTHSLVEFLAIDRTILFIMCGMTLVISIIGLLATHKVTVSIRRLNQFAERAGNGDSIYEGYSFPHDELGSIAANIVKIYVQRDQQHRETIRLEQDKARLKKQLTNNINHELKTPVASILVSLDLLDDHPDLPETKKRELMGRIRGNAGRLSALLKDVSTITRMEDGQGMIDKKRIDLTALINDIADEARPRTEMQIDVNVPRLWINGDRMLLESIFHNLIDNAISHSEGSEIHITADEAGNFKVWDNGKGIDARHLPHIFERFYRVDDGRTRSTGGTGLGLSIVKNAVAVHGGSIRAVSTKGLLFEFNLGCTD
jgi:two-component system OmpR family sensor kinase